MQAEMRKTVSYLAAFLITAAVLLSLSPVPAITVMVASAGFAVFWVATLVLSRQGSVPLRGPLKAIVCGILLVTTVMFLVSDGRNWASALRTALLQGDIWFLFPAALFAGMCLVSLDLKDGPEDGRVLSSLPDLAFGLAAMTLLYLALRALPHTQEDLPALWGHTSIHYLIVFAFFYVASYITRCFVSIWQRHANETRSSLAPGERSLRSFMRVFISTLPLLGFLGTVLGITQALSGLPGLVGGDGALDQNTSAALGAGLASIAIAFETTMLGLIGSLLANLALSYAEKLESDLEMATQA